MWRGRPVWTPPRNVYARWSSLFAAFVRLLVGGRARQVLDLVGATAPRKVGIPAVHGHGELVALQLIHGLRGFLDAREQRLRGPLVQPRAGREGVQPTAREQEQRLAVDLVDVPNHLLDPFSVEAALREHPFHVPALIVCPPLR